MPRRRPPEPPIFTFRVRIRGGFYAPSNPTAIWRDIEIAANQTLVDLGNAISLAFDFDDPHLWSFFLSGRAWDRTTEYPLENREDMLDGSGGRSAARIQIRNVPFPGVAGKKEFLFLFDYGDEWHFGVKLRHLSDRLEPGAHYPRIVARQGESPPQYSDLEEDAWDEKGDDDP